MDGKGKQRELSKGKKEEGQKEKQREKQKEGSRPSGKHYQPYGRNRLVTGGGHAKAENTGGGESWVFGGVVEEEKLKCRKEPPLLAQSAGKNRPFWHKVPERTDPSGTKEV